MTFITRQGEQQMLKRLALLTIATTLAAACTRDVTGVSKEPRAPSRDQTVADTTTRRGPGYMGSGV